VLERQRIHLLDFYNADPQLVEFFNLEVNKLNYLISLGNFWGSVQSRMEWGVENTPYSAEDPFEAILAEGLKAGIKAEGMGEIGRQWLRVNQEIKNHFDARQQELLAGLGRKYNYPFAEVSRRQKPAARGAVADNQRERTIDYFVLYRAQKLAVESANVLPSQAYAVRSSALKKALASAQFDPRLRDYLSLLIQEWAELTPIYKNMEAEVEQAGRLDDFRGAIMTGDDPLSAMLGLYMNDSVLSRQLQRISDEYAPAFERVEKKYDTRSVQLLKQLESCYKYPFLAIVYAQPSRMINPDEFTAEAAPCQGSAGRTITAQVPGNQAVTRSGVRLCKGDYVRLSASGSVLVGQFVGSTGPNGINSNLVGPMLNYLPEAFHGALLYQIGDAREDGWLFAGSQSTFVADKSGELFFTVNDRDIKNNRGSFSVALEIYR
jgi:hypothetical protein